MNINPRRKRQFYGLVTGTVFGSFLIVWLNLPSNEKYTMLGPMNTGHESLVCNECHTPARGTPGQQIQTNINYLFGKRKSPVTFGLENVDNEKCLACHERPNDRHPVHRFEEPRFADARKNIMPTQCASCHNEHHGVRITIQNSGFCINCHKDTKLNNDPLDVPHHELIAQNMWTTCLQCHDFHGNHIYNVAERMLDTIPIQVIRNYFNGGDSPYTKNKKYEPKRSIHQ